MGVILDATGQPFEKPAELDERVLTTNWRENIEQYEDHMVNPDKTSLRTYETMVDTDETIQSAIEFLSLAAISRLGQYVHKGNSTIQKFVRAQLEAMREPNFHIALEDMLSGKWAGFSVTENCLRYNSTAGKVDLAGLMTMRPSTVEFRMHHDGPAKGRVRSVWQYHWDIGQVEIPRTKVAIYSHRARFGNPYGRSALRSVWPIWFLKTAMVKAWASGLERHGNPVAASFIQNPDAEMVTPSGKKEKRSAYYLRMLKRIQAGTALVFDAGNPDKKLQERLELLHPNRPISSDFMAFVDQYCNKMAMRGLLMPSLILNNDSVGSYALGQKQYDMFLLGLDRLLKDLVHILVWQIIYWLIVWNWGERSDGDYGEFETMPIEEEDQKLWAEIVYQLTQSGYISPELRGDLEYARSKVNFPVLSAEERAQLSEANQKKAQMPQGDPQPPGPPRPGPKTPDGPQGPKKGQLVGLEVSSSGPVWQVAA